jgi:hypothetical protein
MGVLSLRSDAVTYERIARGLALLTVNQALGVLPPQRERPGPSVGLLMDDSSVRTRAGTSLDVPVQLEIRRHTSELLAKELYYLRKAAVVLHEGRALNGFEPVPPSHPSYDPALEQVFAPLPPLQQTRSLEAPRS